GDAVADRVGEADHLDGTGTVGEPPDEAAFLKRRDQAMDAGLGAQVERFLHLVEGRRHAGLLEPLVNEAEQLVLLACQHVPVPRRSDHEASKPSLVVLGSTKTNHERTLSVPYVFRNHLIWSEQSDRLSKLKVEDDAG